MAETTTTARALHLLELLQARRFWPGTELAARLGVPARTLRRDIDRLRELGYTVAAHRGRDGGYSLATGGDLPPLVFTPEEATVIAAALSSSAASGAAGGGELVITALAKVEQVLPQRLRRRVRAVRSSVSLAASPVATLDLQVLAVLALGCRDRERLDIRYRGAGDDGERRRRIEPVHLVPRGPRWYLLCWDLDRDDWRTFRVDRITRADPTGARFTPRRVPGGNAASFVAQRLGELQAEYAATILIHAPMDEVSAYLGGYARNLSVAPDPDQTLWRIADVRLEVLASGLIWLRWPFEVLDSPQLAALLRDRATAFAAASQRYSSSA